MTVWTREHRFEKCVKSILITCYQKTKTEDTAVLTLG